MTPRARAELEGKLAEVSRRILEIEEEAERLKRERDRYIKRLRSGDDPTPLRRLAVITGLSNPRISQIDTGGR